MTGGAMGACPNWYHDIEDARLLGVKPWEIHAVPLFWRQRARAAHYARLEALAQLAADKKVPAVYSIGF